jgi:predicted Zn-dependent protease
MKTLTADSDKAALRSLLLARFHFSEARERDLLLSGLMSPRHEITRREFDAARSETLRINAIVDPFERQTATVKSFPTSPWNWLVLGDMLVERREFKAARECYDKATLLGPKIRAAWLGAAKTAEVLGDRDRARECMTTYQKLKD